MAAYCRSSNILFSSGSIHLRPDPPSGAGEGTRFAPGPLTSLADGVEVDPQYYAGRQGHLDLAIAMSYYRFAEKICSTQPLASIIRGQVYPLAFEVCDDRSLRDWIMKSTVTDWHPVGTCSMGGRAGARAGVVDERLRVYGVRRLRVVDASVMPLQISAHLQATVYAIAEKAAHMILEELE